MLTVAELPAVCVPLGVTAAEEDGALLVDASVEGDALAETDIVTDPLSLAEREEDELAVELRV